MYKSNNGKKNIEVKLYDETVWLNQKQIVELFESSKSNISEHIKHIFKENELDYFIKMNRKDVLKTKGTVAHVEALEKARSEYKKYKNRISLNPTEVELHYLEATNELKKLTDKK